MIPVCKKWILDDCNWDTVKIASNSSNSNNQQALKTVDSSQIYDDENIQFQPILLCDLLKELYLRGSLESMIVTWSFTKQYQ